MFTTLIESRHARQRHEGGTFVSIAVHAALITLAVQLTIGAARQVDKVRAEGLIFTDLKKEAPPKPKEQPKPVDQPRVQGAAVPAKGFQVLIAPVKVPDVLPDIDLGKATTREEDFSGRGAAGGIARGVVGGEVKKVDQQQPYFEFEVEKSAMPFAENRPPRYPEQLRDMNIEGTVVVQFVIDTLGRADVSSLKVLKTTHVAFSDAVRSALGHWRFYPAEVGGRKVRVLVQQPIEFALAKQ